MALVEDRSVYPTMLALKECLCEELEKAGGPTLCFCDIMPGTSDGFIDVDCEGDGCGGSAWVRLRRVYFSSRLPEDETAQTDLAFRAVELEVGVARCITPIDDDGTAPDAVTQHMDARQILSDMAAMERAIRCCFGSVDDPVREYALGSYISMPGMGGAGGGVWNVFVRVS
jgi:hypothetical protein